MAEKSTTGQPAKSKGWSNLEHAAILFDDSIVTGIVQHPVTKHWQTWVFVKKNDNINCLTAHSERYDAVLVALDIAMAWKAGHLKNPKDVAVFLKCLPSDAKVMPLPEEILPKLKELMVDG
jgi:hypothetical protein